LRLAEEIALRVINTPFREQVRCFRLFHPFRHCRGVEMSREVEEGADEKAIVRRSRQILNEGAVDLDQIQAEPPQIFERCVPCAEIIHRHANAKRLHRGDGSAGISTSADVSVISITSRSAAPAASRTALRRRSGQSGS
jgi:hypothetical protein